MAVPNMIVTLAANTAKFTAGMMKAAGTTKTFGAKVGMVFSSIGLSAVSLIGFIGNLMIKFAEMGRESRKSSVQLDYMVKRMFGVGRTATSAAVRLKEYANKVMLATAVDDEQVQAVQRKLLVFKSLDKSIGEMGGTFDRTTMAAIDLAAAGFGDMEANATKLGRILENPTKNLNALNRAGITFTETEKKKIARLQESGKLYKAQDLVLKSIEGRLGGIAERSATGFDKLNAQFQQMGDTIGEAINPSLEIINKELAAWIASPQGKKDLQAIVDGFVGIAKAIAIAVDAFVRYNEQAAIANEQRKNTGSRFYSPNLDQNGDRKPSSTPTTPSVPKAASVVVNFNSPVDSVSAGREISRVLTDYNRANGMR